MKWIKASDRTPNSDSPYYHFRLDGFHKTNGNFFDVKQGEIAFGVHGCGVFEDYIIYEKDFDKIEWLDESVEVENDFITELVDIIGRSLLCSMMRRAADKSKFVHVDELQERIKSEAEKIQVEKNWTLERKAKEYDSLHDKVEAFEKASGIEITYQWGDGAKKVGEAVKLIMNGELENYRKSLQRIEEQVKGIYEGLHNVKIWNKMAFKPYKERLIIAGALIAAEIDRLQNLQP
jgi:hypothetical protein